jgi:hypothetical protein
MMRRTAMPAPQPADPRAVVPTPQHAAGADDSPAPAPANPQGAMSGEIMIAYHGESAAETSAKPVCAVGAAHQRD